MIRTHYYLSVNMLGDVYSACGIKCGHTIDDENYCFDQDGKQRKVTCKNCKRTKVYKGR